MLPSIRAITLALLSAVSLGAGAVDASNLKPPVGAKAAIVVFEDLEGPESAGAFSVIWEAAEAHKIPVMLYDFPLPRHNWSFDAAVWARYFDTQNTRTVNVGNEFRRYTLANQKQISRDNLQQWVQKFAGDHKIILPSVPDPGGRLAQKVKSDFAFGQQIGVEHTPTIWVISNGGVSQPLVEEASERELNQMIDDVLRKAPPAVAAKKTQSRKSASQHQQR